MTPRSLLLLAGLVLAALAYAAKLLRAVLPSPIVEDVHRSIRRLDCGRPVERRGRRSSVKAAIAASRARARRIVRASRLASTSKPTLPPLSDTSQIRDVGCADRFIPVDPDPPDTARRPDLVYDDELEDSDD